MKSRFADFKINEYSILFYNLNHDTRCILYHDLNSGYLITQKINWAVTSGGIGDKTLRISMRELANEVKMNVM